MVHDAQALIKFAQLILEFLPSQNELDGKILSSEAVEILFTDPDEVDDFLDLVIRSYKMCFERTR